MIVLPAASRVATPSPAVWQPEADSFTIAFLPDTHVVTESIWEWRSIYNWLVLNKDLHNIVAIVGEGDIVTDAYNSSLWSLQFDAALVGWDAFDAAGIPNVAGIGNHDYDTDASVTNRNATRFDSKFPLSRISSKSWYGGSYDGSMRNCWIKIDAGSRKLLILMLEIWPDDNMLSWGLGVCKANQDREVIFMTHSHLNPDGTQTASSDLFGSGTTAYQSNDGPGVWAKLGKLAPNMKFIVSGHQYRPNEPFAKTSYLLGVGDNGNRVHQWYCNYQTYNQGNGMVGLLRQYTGNGNADLCAFSTLHGDLDSETLLNLTW